MMLAVIPVCNWIHHAY